MSAPSRSVLILVQVKDDTVRVVAGTDPECSLRPVGLFGVLLYLRQHLRLVCLAAASAGHVSLW